MLSADAALILHRDRAHHPVPGCCRDDVEGGSSATRGTATAKQPLVVALEEGGSGQGEGKGRGRLPALCLLISP